MLFSSVPKEDTLDNSESSQQSEKEIFHPVEGDLPSNPVITTDQAKSLLALSDNRSYNHIFTFRPTHILSVLLYLVCITIKH
jgi:hypothetical protein